MSLFDSIKYPISDDPTAMQIDALPDEIFDAWADTLSEDGCVYLLRYNIVSWANDNIFRTSKYIDRLRKRFNCNNCTNCRW